MSVAELPVNPNVIFSQTPGVFCLLLFVPGVELHGLFRSHCLSDRKPKLKRILLALGLARLGADDERLLRSIRAVNRNDDRRGALLELGQQGLLIGSQVSQSSLALLQIGKEATQSGE